MTRDSDHPRTDGFAFAQPLLPFDRAPKGLICTVFDVRVIDRLANDTGDDGAHERTQRCRVPRKTIVFSMF